MFSGRSTGLLQSVGGLSAAAMTRWWSSSGAERARCPKNEPQTEGLHLIGNWQTPSDTPDCLAGSVPMVYHFPQTPRVEGIETLFCRVLVMVHVSQSRTMGEYRSCKATRYRRMGVVFCYSKSSFSSSSNIVGSSHRRSFGASFPPRMRRRRGDILRPTENQLERESYGVEYNR